MTPIARSCTVCGTRTPTGASRCDKHRTGGRRRRSCRECGTPTTGPDYCPDHAPLTVLAASGARDRQQWRAQAYGPDYKRNRPLAIARDNGQCVLCGHGIPDNTPIQVDHITPPSRGGDSHLDNLRTLCIPCHQSKTLNRTPPEGTTKGTKNPPFQSPALSVSSVIPSPKPPHPGGAR